MTAAWPLQAYLDALRPEPGWAVEAAILASYSADVASIGAALLALAGRDNDAGSGSPSDLAEAVEELRGRVRIVIQRGRLARLKRFPAVAGILDQFLAEVPFDEAEHSWHPKVGLVCFSHPDAGKVWRFWMGSRNLTSAVNLDFGLLLSNQGAATKGEHIEGLSSLAGRLAEFAKLPDRAPATLAREVGQVRWISPSGFKVRSISLTSGLGDGILPQPPSSRIEEVMVISPFLDGTFVGELGRWGDVKTRRSLLSTHAELRKLASQVARPLRGFSDRILVFAAPVADEIEVDDPEPTTGVEIALEPGAEQAPPLGLHAKILAACAGQKLWLWVGSANATNRAWSAGNVEVIAEVEADPRHLTGLCHLLEQGRPMTEEELAQDPAVEIDEIRERLSKARKHVAAHLSGVLSRCGGAFVLVADAPPHSPDPEILLEAGLATGSLVRWPREVAKLDLGLQPVSLQTELVQFRLLLEGRECGWIQRFTAIPPLDETRDRAALARHLGPNAFLEWVRSLLQGSVAGEDDPTPWDAPEAPLERYGAVKADFDSLSLEDILSCWARDARAFERADRRVQAYIDLIMAGEVLDANDLARLQKLKIVWNTLTSELLEQS